MVYTGLNFRTLKKGFLHSLDETHLHLLKGQWPQLLFVYQYVLEEVIELKSQRQLYLYLTPQFCLKQLFLLCYQGI